MMEPIVEIENLSKVYRKGNVVEYLSLRDTFQSLLGKSKEKKESKEFFALKDISLQIHPGESIGIIGQNGAGKSTLLKILSRITPPTEGKVTLRGRTASLLEVGTGFHSELTGRENIFFNGALMGMAKYEIQAQFDSIVDFSGVSSFIDTPLKRYSSGMYVRLAFAVAAHLNPDVLIIDEVLAVGDMEFQKKCIEKMEEVRNSGKTVIFVSHQMEMIEKLCQKGVLLKKGIVQMTGDTRSIVDAYISENTSTITLHNFDQIREPMSEFKLTHSTLFDENGAESTTLKAGQACKIRTHYSCPPDTFDKFSFIITIFNIRYAPMIQLISETAALEGLAIDLEKGFFDVKIEELLLIPGHYHVNYQVYHKGHYIDLIAQAFNFEVAFSDYYGTGILPPHGVLLPEYSIE